MEEGPVNTGRHRGYGGFRITVGAVCALAAMLVVGPATPARAANNFPDVPSTHPYYAAIEGLVSLDAVGGYGNGTFGPGDFVMRAQFAKMIVDLHGRFVVFGGTDATGKALDEAWAYTP